MTEPPEQPNMVLIVVDDLGWADLSCSGSTFYETPNIDRLARDGMRFTDAYAAAPVCSPTRASIMSGKYPARVGVTQFIGGHTVGALLDVPYFHQLPMSELSLAAALRDGGYQTWHVGKWHLGQRGTWPDRHGFDVNIGGCGWGHPPTYFSPYDCPTLDDGPDGEYLTDRLTEEAVRLIETAEDRPFLLNLWHYAVHIPVEAPAHLVDKYRHKAVALGLDQTDPITSGEPMPTWHQRGRHVQRRTIQSDPGYAAMVENLDQSVGQILDALKRTGKGENTLVIFTSDNGGLSTAEGSPTCNAPLSEGKGWMYDGGVRVPLIVRWPETVRPGVISDAVTSSPDLYPTLLEAAQLPLLPDQHVDGVSLLPLLRGDHFDRGPIFWHYPHYPNQGGAPGAAVREGRHKLILFFEDRHVELYDLIDDIAEANDLSDAHPERAAALTHLLERWLDDVRAAIPQPNPRHTPSRQV